MDTALATKEATRRMTAPDKADLNKLVRIARYLARHPRLMNWHRDQQESEQVAACTDSDWQGARERGDRL